jgi:hypothetical protein
MSAAWADGVGSGTCLLDRLFGSAGLRRISHGPGVTVSGVFGGNLQSLRGGGSLQHGIFRDLPVFFLGFLVLRLGGEADVSITLTFDCGQETLVLLLGKAPNYNVQICVRHSLLSPSEIKTFHMINYAFAQGVCNYGAGECAIYPRGMQSSAPDSHLLATGAPEFSLENEVPSSPLLQEPWVRECPGRCGSPFFV